MSEVQIRIKITNGHMEAFIGDSEDRVAKAVRFYKHSDGFSGWVVQSDLQKDCYSDPIPNRRQAWKELKMMAEAEVERSMVAAKEEGLI